MDDFETVRFGLQYGRMTSDPLAALDCIEARMQELEAENERLREALAHIAEPFEASNEKHQGAAYLRRIARRALAEQEPST